MRFGIYPLYGQTYIQAAISTSQSNGHGAAAGSRRSMPKSPCAPPPLRPLREAREARYGNYIFCRLDFFY